MAPSTPAPAALHPYQQDGHWWFDCLTCELTCGPFTGRDQADDDARSHALQQHRPEPADNAAQATRHEEELYEARSWARHGYEIGQRHCGWTDHGVAPAWLTEGWPLVIESCEHLKQAADFDTQLTAAKATIERVRTLPNRPEVEDAANPWSADHKAGYRHAMQIVRRAIDNPSTTDAPAPQEQPCRCGHPKDRHRDDPHLCLDCWRTGTTGTFAQLFGDTSAHEHLYVPQEQP